MEEIRIPVTLTPHYQSGKPSGYYLLAQRLFPRGAPILVKQQFAGFSDGLVVTVNHPPQLDTPLKMAVVCPVIGGQGVTWLSKVSIYPMSMGFRMYIPGNILKPPTGALNFETTGIFHGAGELYWLHVPAVSSDILLGRKALTNG
jgi:hypothetical protein